MNAPEAPSFGDFLERSLREVRTDAPRAWTRLCATLSGRAVLLVVDGEAVLVQASDDAVALRRGGGVGDALGDALGDARPTVAVRTTRATILRMIDGETSLERAVVRGEFDLVGALDELLAFHDALRAYLHGAVRSPAQPLLLRAWRAAAT